ncbi:MAG: DUF4249 domain-containing protein [Saprospiraceae bacterium]
MKNYFLFLITILLLTSCEDIIDLELEQNEPQLVVDAWLNDQPGEQVIKLRRTINYLDNSFTPEVIGATVTVADIEITATDTIINQIYIFEDENNNGDYVWTPSTPGEVMIQEGSDYGLLVDLDGDQYVSLSTANRTIPIDSIGYEFQEDEVGQPDGIYAQLYAIDAVGVGDAYWIKTYKNGAFLNKPQEMNLAFDGAFGSGSNSDGILFISPIRFAINRVADVGDDVIDDSDVPPYAMGDSIRVEIHSVTQEAFFHLAQAQEQMLQGDNGLFATPINNVPTNIFPESENAKENPVGFFCVSLVSTAERVVE